MFDGFDPADLLGVRNFARPGLVLDLGDPINLRREVFWPLSEPAGLAFDLSQHRRHGTPGNAPAATTRIGGAARLFNGTDQYIETAWTTVFSASGAIGWWQRSEQAYNSGTIEAVWGANAVGGITFQKYSNNSIYAGWTYSGDQRLVIAADAVNWPVNTDTFYTLTWGPAGTFLYVNSVLVGSNTTPPNTGTPSDPAFFIGRQGAGWGAYFQGAIWNVGGFSRVPSIDEIRRLYRNPLAGIISEDDRLYVPRKAPAGGTVWNETLSDSLSSAESVAGSLTAPVTLAEALTGADATPVAMTGAAALAEALTGADSLAATLAAVAVLSDPATAGEVLAPAMTAGVTLSDAGTVADDLLPAVTCGLALSDSLTGADSLTIAAVMAAALAESVAGAENFAAVLLASTSLTDAATLADAYALAIPGTPAPASRTVTWRAHDRLATWATEARTVTWRAVDRIAKWQE